MRLPEIEVLKLSASVVQKCDLATYYRLTQPQPLRPIYFLLGELFHDAVENVIDGNNPSEETRNALAGTDVNPKDIDLKNKSINFWHSRLERYLKIYLPFAETLRNAIKKQEIPFRFEYDGLILSGRIDGIVNENIGQIEAGIIDHKTSSRLPLEADFYYSLQTLFYSFAGYMMLGRIPSITYAVCYSAGKRAGIRLFTIQKTERDIEYFLKNMKGLQTRLQLGLVEPKINFGCRFCDYKHLCPARKETGDG